MRKSILAIFFAAIAGNAAAEWTLIGEDDVYSKYVELNTISSSDNTVKMRMLDDYRQPQSLTPMEKKYSSVAYLYEFDCVKKHMRLLQTTMYQGQMLKGSKVSTFGSSMLWMAGLPGTNGEQQIEIACKK